MEEAIAWVKRCPMTGDSDVEIRPIFAPEVRQQVESRWAKVASRDTP